MAAKPNGNSKATGVGVLEPKLGETPEQISELLSLLRVHSKFDFHCYGKKMLLRRVERRMRLKNIEGLGDYLGQLQEQPAEVKQLARDLLISVTNFFRDSDALQELIRGQILPLIQGRDADVPFRVWIPGCASGEEPYTLVMLLMEELAKAPKSCRLQIFATDVDEEALTVARRAVYPASLEADVSEDRRARFFTKVDASHYQISKPVRDAVMFARQNLVADPPFSKLDLIGCRNVLIYLDPDVQAKVLKVFHFGLQDGGYLLLGSSETIGEQGNLFESISRRHQIYCRISTGRREAIEFPLAPSVQDLKAANEKHASMNEELTAVDELEKSHEELRSLNEELATVNDQLHEKIDELEHANNDLANFFTCTNIAIVFLDTTLRIRRYTPPAARLLDLIDTDIGRAIRDIRLTFADATLQLDAEFVLRQGTPLEKEVKTEDGGIYVRRITPFRKAFGAIEGIVLTFMDVTPLKQAAVQFKLLSTVLSNSNDATIVHDFAGRITHWNQGAQRLYGYTETEALELNIRRLIPREMEPWFLEICDRLKHGGRVDSFEMQRLTKDGRLVDVWVTATALTDDSGRPFAIVKTDRDITEKKKAQALLEREVAHRTAAFRASEARLRAILNAPHDGIITIHHDGIIDSANQAAQRIFGYSAAEMIGMNFRGLVPSGPRQEDYFIRHLEIGDSQAIGITREVEARRKDGTTFFADLAMSEVEGQNLLTAIIRDNTRRKELEREVVEIATLEQQRIGQDLHDECGQQLTALGLLASSLYELLKDHGPAEIALARKIGRGISGVLRHVRNIAHGLALSEVNGPDLPDALSELASRLSETSGVQCDFQESPDADIQDDVQATHLYHIAQEACTNALRHAKAHHISIRLNSTDQAITLEIRDDGTGMSEDSGNGLGLQIMHNRAAVIGARLAIDGAKPNGTVISCTLTKERRRVKNQYRSADLENSHHR